MNFGGYMHDNLLAANKPSVYCKDCISHILVQHAFIPRHIRNSALVSTGFSVNVVAGLKAALSVQAMSITLTCISRYDTSWMVKTP